ncbi:MAG: holo-ACP synthase [Pseudomonadota bacterium]|nr:holo-ACP synthase [Pseudomonadota bacterium]
MIHGVGVDLVDISRLAERLDKQPKLINKLLSQTEQLYLQGKANAQLDVAYVAKRFAAKEALSKALGLGLRSPITLQNISVLNDANGRPYFEFADELSRWLEQRDIGQIHLSLSDTELVAQAFVVIDQ